MRFLPTVARVLPGIRVIHLVRDGRDCFASQLHPRFSLYSAAIRPPARQAAEWCEAGVHVGDRLMGIELAAPEDLYAPTLLVEDDAFDSRRLVARVRPDAVELYDTLRGLAGGSQAAP